MTKINFISFGQSGYYNYISNDLLKRLSKVYPGSVIKCYTEKDLPKWIINYALSHHSKRGFGQFRWKPFIIYRHLKSMNDNDVLLYIDGRSHLKKKQNITWLDEFLDSNQDFALSNEFYEYMFTSENVLNYFKVKKHSEIINSPQYLATFILLRKTPTSIEVIKKWNELARDNKELFEDNIGRSSYKEFIYNKGDQPVLSLLLKTNPLVKISLIPRDTFGNSDTLVLHYKVHAYNKHPYLYFHLKRFLPNSIFNFIFHSYLLFTKKNG